MRHLAYDGVRIWIVRVGARTLYIDGIESLKELNALVRRLENRGYRKIAHTKRRARPDRRVCIDVRLAFPAGSLT